MEPKLRREEFLV